MSKKKISFEEHQKLGLELHRIRFELIELRLPLYQRATKSNSKLNAAIKKLDEARSVLDDELFRDFPERDTNDLANVYYSPTKEGGQ